MFIVALTVILVIAYVVHRGEVNEGSQPPMVWEDWLFDKFKKDSV